MSDTPSLEFDAYAADYDAALNRGLALSGETKEFFADGRARWLRDLLPALSAGSRGLDFGCGVGAATPYLIEHLKLASLTGADVSEASLRLAKEQHGSPGVSFVQCEALAQMPDAHEVAYCNGVFHHIEPEQRAASAKSVFDSVRPGGHFAFWENNRWNPMVHFIMSRVPFDADAQMLFPHQARRLLRDAGFEIVRTDYLFVFPSVLAGLRFLEPWLCRLPFGGQYQVLCRKPL
jgi:trans-aconitate methyltransferase